MRALVVVPEELPRWPLDGRPIVERLQHRAARLGWAPEAVGADRLVPEDGCVVIDARYGALGSASLARLAERDGHPVLRTSSGHAVAAVLPPTAAGQRAGDALELARGPTVALWDDRESVEVLDGWTFALAARAVRGRRARKLAAAGVQLVDPDRVIVEADVVVEPGAVLWPDVVLRGHTRIAAGAEIHPGCVLDDTTVGEGSVVKAHSVCTGATIGPACAVGPMAHLRPGAVLARDVKVGNFVEVKKATLQEGVRASHLSYLGDADIGERTNIGAGTITCNYDGFRKHRTVVGHDVFIGSNTSLVAPVSVGDHAVTGASSAITRDVPDAALVVERAELRVLKGRGRALMERNRRLAGKPPRDGDG